MNIRNYQQSDCEAVSSMFYETVHSVNTMHYTEKQVNAWAASKQQLQKRHETFLNQYSLVAEIDGVIVGFGSIDNTGYLDMLYVHKDYQNQGVATALCNLMEKDFAIIKTHSSITAKPFFEKRGYRIVKKQEVERMGVKMNNFLMQKCK